MPIDCNNPRNDQERNLCACQQSTNALTNALNSYETKYTAYTSSVAEYNRQHSDWQTRHSAWQSNRNARRNVLANEEKWAGCGACGSNPGCPGGWRWERNANGCGALNWGCEQVCKRTDETINRDISGWDAENPQPAQPNRDAIVLASPSPPSNLNIMCCSQIFSDIQVEGGDVNLRNVSQNCQQQIQNKLNEPDPPPEPTPVLASAATGTETGGDGNRKKMFLIIAIVVLIIFFSCSIISLLLLTFSDSGSNSDSNLSSNSGSNLGPSPPPSYTSSNV